MDQTARQDSRLPSLEDSLNLGQSIHLEFDDYPQANGCYQLWGLCPSQSIMVAASHIRVLDGLAGKSFKARLYLEQFNQACAFRSEVISKVDEPSSYLHLALPSQLMMGQTRQNFRIKMQLPACICHNEESHPGSVIDASISGCRLKLPPMDLKVGDTIQLSFELSVFGIEQGITADVVVRSRAESSGSLYVGVQFGELSDQQRITLYSFLNASNNG